MDIFSTLNLYWKPVVEIFILWFIIYHFMLFFEGTRAVQVLRGLVILIVSYLFFQNLRFEVLDWFFTKLFTISVIALLVIFHPEIRQGLARLGRRKLFSVTEKEEELDYVLSQISKAVEILCKNKTGALIAIENKDPLAAYVESGVVVDAQVSADLIQTICTPGSILHDGGILIQHGRIVAAGCLFPLSDKKELNRIFGTRHRAALGLSEETDAILIVVSEERQDMSLIYRGKLYKDLSNFEIATKAKKLIESSETIYD